MSTLDKKAVGDGRESLGNGTTTIDARNYHGIDAHAIPSGVDEVYEKKVAIMNQALIDMGMGSFQWMVFAMTGFGWFVDNVGTYACPASGSRPNEHLWLTALCSCSSGCRQSPSSARLSGTSSTSRG